MTRFPAVALWAMGLALLAGCPSPAVGPGKAPANVTIYKPKPGMASPTPRPGPSGGLGVEPRPSGLPQPVGSPSFRVGPFVDFPPPFPTEAPVPSSSPWVQGPTGKVSIAFDGAEGKGWTLGPSLVRPRFGLAAVVVADAAGPGRLAVLEGENRPSMEVFDPTYGWSLADGYDQTRGVLPTEGLRPVQKGRSRLAAAVDGKDIWVAGGDTMSVGGLGIRGDAFLYRYLLDGPVGPCPVQALLMPEPQIMARAVGVVGEHLVMAGGSPDDLAATTTVDLLPLTAKGANVLPFPPFADLKVGPAMPLGVAGAASVVWNDKLYVLGGYVVTGGTAVAQKAAQVFDGQAWGKDGQGGAPPALPEALHSAAAAALNGRIYLAGGCPQGREVVGRVRSWAPGEVAWREELPLPTPRALLALAAHDGRLVALGGLGSEGRPLRTVERWRP